MTGLRPEGYGRLMAAGCVRFAQGATAPAALRVVDCPSRNAYKVSVTGFTFSIIRYDKHYGNQPPPVAFPPFGALRHHLPAPLGSVSHDSQVALLPYSTAITDSQYFARHCVPSKYVRWCDSCSLATAERWGNKALKSSPFISSSQHSGAL